MDAQINGFSRRLLAGLERKAVFYFSHLIKRKTMSTQPAFSEVAEERSTILRTLAGNCDALKDLGERLHDLQSRLYHPQPDAMPTPKSEVSDNVESLVEVQSTLIRQHVETVTRMLNRLA